MKKEILTNDDISEVADYELRAIGNTHPAVAIKIIELKKLRSAVLGLRDKLVSMEQELAKRRKNTSGCQQAYNDGVRAGAILSISQIDHWLGAVLEEKE